MKIVSWNLERPNQNVNSIKNQFIFETITALNPDIIFLSETNSSINFINYFKLESTELPDFHDNQKYDKGENRVSIISKYPFLSQIKTYDNFTSICGEVITDLGNLVLYGSIIGSFGGKNKFFKNDLHHQKKELKIISKNICFAGDFNISFSGFPYPSRKVISETEQFFQENNLINLTKENSDSALHIVLSKDFLKDINYKSHIVPVDRKISDHDLVWVELF